MNRNIRPKSEAASGQPNTLPTRLLVERLRLEAVFRQQEMNLVIVHNLMMTPFPGFLTGVLIEETDTKNLAVHIRTPLGEVLMADEARELLKTRCPHNGDQNVELSPDNILFVAWTREYQGPVDTGQVMEAFAEHVRVAFETQRVVAEECYLTTETNQIMKNLGGRY